MKKLISLLLIHILLVQTISVLAMNVNIGASRPDFIDPVLLARMPQNIFYPINIQAGFTNPDSTLICQVDGSFSAYNLHTYGQKDRSPYVSFSLKPVQQGTQKKTIKCKLNHLTDNNKNVQTDLSFDITFEDSGIPPLRDAINAKIEEAQSDSLLNQRWISDMNKIINQLKYICRLFGTISDISVKLNDMKPVIWLASKVIPFAGQSIWSGYCTLTYNYDTKIRNPFWDSSLGGFMKHTCFIVNCEQCGPRNDNSNPGTTTDGTAITPLISDRASTDDARFYEAGSDYGQNTVDFFADYSGASRVNPGFSVGGQSIMNQSLDSFYSLNTGNSIVYSAACLCLPGVVMHLNMYRGIQCKYVKCLQDQLNNGLYDISFCEEQKSFETCSKVMGEAFTLFPWTNILENILNQIGQLISYAPLGVAGFIVDKTFRNTPKSNWLENQVQDARISNLDEDDDYSIDSGSDNDGLDNGLLGSLEALFEQCKNVKNDVNQCQNPSGDWINILCGIFHAYEQKSSYEYWGTGLVNSLQYNPPMDECDAIDG